MDASAACIAVGDTAQAGGIVERIIQYTERGAKPSAISTAPRTSRKVKATDQGKGGQCTTWES